jgi:arginyl-tRNA--protein-N-Asp/Glu arginylyltransferase
MAAARKASVNSHLGFVVPKLTGKRHCTSCAALAASPVSREDFQAQKLMGQILIAYHGTDATVRDALVSRRLALYLRPTL